ncbi:MAG: hypothetical protein J6D21_06940 [Clostridia bacterium]|nr:hypothetical protein [Clostridia bacterium]
MGLIGFVGDLIAIARLKNATKEMVQNGVLSQEQEKEIWGSAKEAGKQAFVESRQQQRIEEQRRIQYECCANCRYFVKNSVYSSKMDPYSCTKHDFDFDEEDIRNGDHRTGCCDCFWGR